MKSYWCTAVLVCFHVAFMPQQQSCVVVTETVFKGFTIWPFRKNFAAKGDKESFNGSMILPRMPSWFLPNSSTPI